MNTRPPTWELKSERCSYCGGQGELIFSRCPACSTIVLICAECGTVYAIQGKRPASEIGDSSGETRCRCGGGHLYHEFQPATADEIRALGFVTGEYR
jgi:hypothetical protein